ncbi:MAG: LysR family transcriptional regulator [Gammaproteobacteria bacterium]|nr:LysR family transcriptional regulator [Gammaproteobacteria bacterium]
MSDLDRFEIFTHVAQLGSITQAASQLKTTKAALSKQIKRLEADFNITLFTRHKQRITLTDQGESLLEQCLRLRHELDEARSLCKHFHDEHEGHLHVVAFSYFAQKLIFPRLKSFLEQYPKISLRIDTTERVPNFIEEQIDLALGFALPVPNPGEVVQKRMATTRYILCASLQYFAEKGTPQTLEDLHQHHYISHIARPNHQIIKLKSKYQLSLQPYLEVNSVASMIECAKQHLGLIQLPLYMVEDLLKRGELIEVLSEYQAINASVYYHYPQTRHMKPKVQRFIEFFLPTSMMPQGLT